ncbi:MAG: isoprenyl transferase [Gammaproteobacteria bacterium]|nr:isoprenyl transferase [Gammaproteobacteria bacterium]
MTDKTIPQHVAIIMDGNGRWAKKRLMPRTYGHKKGVDATRSSISFFAKSGVKHLTLFAFSSENWSRPEEEVSTLMSLFVSSLQKNTEELHQKGIRIRFIGDRSVFAQKLKDQIQESENLTVNNKLMTLNIAANYGGHWDILNSVRQLAADVKNGQLAPEAISAEHIESYLSLSDSPDPDLFIRTGGEQRLSNFLLWQTAYSELYFSKQLWPDFDEQEMTRALDDFSSRQRRFGKTGEQVS